MSSQPCSANRFEQVIVFHGCCSTDSMILQALSPLFVQYVTKASVETGEEGCFQIKYDSHTVSIHSLLAPLLPETHTDFTYVWCILKVLEQRTQRSICVQTFNLLCTQAHADVPRCTQCTHLCKHCGEYKCTQIYADTNLRTQMCERKYMHTDKNVRTETC